MRKVIGVMIAKGASLRLPSKNRRSFHGRPLFHWNLAKLVHLLPGAVYFDSDTPDMLEEAKALGAIPLRRPEHLCGHEVPSVPLFQNIVQQLPFEPGAVVNVQANSPSCTTAVIRNAIEVMRHTTCTELLTVYADGRVNNGSVWAFSHDRLMNYGDPRVHHPDVLLTDPSTDVHTADDYAQAEREFVVPPFMNT